MDDKPTKGPWELAPEGTYPAGEGYKVLGPWFETKAGHKTRCYVAQFMTKADAEFLVRAQHMDELVEAVSLLVLAIGRNADIEDVLVSENDGLSETLAILAKIKGAK